MPLPWLMVFFFLFLCFFSIFLLINSFSFFSFDSCKKVISKSLELPW